MSGSTQYYVQCWLAKERARQMAWIPEKFAVPGRTVRLTDAGVSEDGWRVMGVGIRLSEDYLRERNRDYLQTRKASDI